MATQSCGLHDLPEDALLTICDYVQPEALLSLSYVSTFWNHFCINNAWPRRIASTLGVRALHLQSCYPSSSAWFRLFKTFAAYPCTSQLSICVELGADDTATSLALRYAVSPHDILRTNSLFVEHQLTSRTHIYIPLLSEESVIQYTGIPTARHTPVLVRENALSRKCFLVVQFRPSPDTPASRKHSHPRLKPDSYVRQLVVKLIARGLSVHADEVKFYLEDANFDVAKAYKQLLADHQYAR